MTSKLLPRLFRPLMESSGLSHLPARLPMQTADSTLSRLPSIARREFHSDKFSTLLKSFHEDGWRAKIKSNPQNLELNDVKNLNKQMDALVSVIEKDGFSGEGIALFKNDDLTAESVEKLLSAIAKTNHVLPGILCVNFKATKAPTMVFFTSALRELDGTDQLVKEKSLRGYQMQNIPLSQENIKILSSRIERYMQEKRAVLLVLNDHSNQLMQPKFDIHTGLFDLNPVVAHFGPRK